jgi:DNA-directed RNA polymerase specialized sigma24 family protein
MRIERRHEAGVEAWSDQELVQRMRRDDGVAIREFYYRFTPVLWKEARRAQVQPALRDDVVNDCLADSAIHLMQANVPIPVNVTGYLIAALRHRLANDRRAERRRLAAGEAAVWHGHGERVVREVCSEASLRASAGPAAESPPLSPVLERLSRVVDAGITAEERQILRWVSASIPQRLIAEWLGVTHNAVRVRVLRLRDRLLEVALRDDGPWNPGEREALYDFFRRSGLSERARRALDAARARDAAHHHRRSPGRSSGKEDDT